MKATETIVREESHLKSRIKDIAVLFKLRLAMLVVISAILGYLMAVESVVWVDLGILVLGGFLLTGSSNAFNQIWERDLDKLMNRTSSRPLPTLRLQVVESLWIATIAGLAGIFLLWYFLNPIAGILGTLALFLYVFLYTPLKQVTSLAVFVGAFPGAIPPMLGYVAGSGVFGLEPGILFAVQFMWQFPHFWAIAWVSHDDYRKAGFDMLPFKAGRSKRSAFQILIYSLFLIPVSLLPWALPQSAPMTGDVSMIVAVILGIAFAFQALKLYWSLELKDARRLMFASFFYLPLIQLVYVLDKI